MRKTERLWTRLAWIFPVALGAALRLRHAWSVRDVWLPHLDHGEGYYEGAVNFLGYHVLADRVPCFFPNGSRGPLYQAFMVLVELPSHVPHPGHIVMAQAILSVLAIAVVYELAAELVSPWAGVLAALWMALDARQIESVGRLDISGFYPVAVLALAAAMIRWFKEPARRSTLILTLTFASSLMCRSSHYALAPLLIAACVAIPRLRRRHLKELPVLGAGLALLLLIPTGANYLRFGRLHPMDAEAGALRLYAASVGEDCCAPGQYDRYVTDVLTERGAESLPSYKYEGLVIRRALRNIAERPVRYAGTFLKNMRVFWSPYVPALALGLVAAFYHGAEPGVLALLLALLSFLGYHVMVVDHWHSEVVLPLLSILAGCGLASLPRPKADFFRRPAVAGRASGTLIALFCGLYAAVLLIFAVERTSLLTGRITGALGDSASSVHRAPLALLDLSVANSGGRYGLESRAYALSAMGLYEKACDDLKRAGRPGHCASEWRLGREGLAAFKEERLNSDLPILAPCEWYGWQTRGTDYLRRCAQASPANPRVRHNLGLALYLSGDKKGAAEQLQAAVRADPSYAEAYLSLSTALFETGRTRDALAAADKAVALARTGPLRDAALSTKASALARLGRSERPITK